MSDAVQDRPYQAIARDRCFGCWEGGDQSTLLVLPTGTGKTVVAGMIARRALDLHGRRTLFLAHREELIHQAEDKLHRFNLTTGIEMGESHARRTAGLFGPADVVIATIQTMQGARLRSWDRDQFGLIIIDEAHHARAASYRTVLDHFRNYWLLGITATPERGDRKNLGAVFRSLAYQYTLRDAILDRYLVPLVAARLVTGVNLDDIRTTGGDYNDADLAARIAPHIEQLAGAFAAECGDRASVLFCPDVRSSEAMADALTQLGVEAEAVSGAMKKFARRDTLRRFHERQFQAIVCCDLLTEGWDEPQVACVGVCRPTRLRSRYGQMIGRGTRPHPDSGKEDCLIIDFAWETTAGHQLCTPVDLFDDSSLSDELRQLAAKILAGSRIDPREAIEEAERIQARERARLAIQLAGNRPQYRKHTYDPVGVGSLVGVALDHEPAWDFVPAMPATAPQLRYLADLGVQFPVGLSKRDAATLIDALVRRRRAGLATPKHLGLLGRLGVDPAVARTMTAAAAREAIASGLGANTKVG